LKILRNPLFIAAT